MLRAFVFCMLIVGGFLCFRSIMRSKWFDRLMTNVFGPDDDSDVISTLDAVEEMAVRRAAEAEQIAEVKQKNAARIRKRVSPAQSNLS